MNKKRIMRLFGKGLKVILGVAFIGIFSGLAINGYVKQSVKSDVVSVTELEDIDPADAVVVLGAYVRPDGQMSLMLKERVEAGIQLYQDGYAKKIIMSGDHGQENYDEVNTMKNYAIEQGVPSEDIFMDHAGFSTYETMYRVRDIFAAEKILVVTQEYHLYRALFNGRAMGLKVKGIACDQAVYQGDNYRKGREVLARIKDFGYTLVKPKPTYLGEAIPVSGSGDLTNDN